MLVLTRRQGEKIHVGDAVITLLAIRGNRVRIGIEAPTDVHILRDEVPRYEPQPDGSCVRQNAELPAIQPHSGERSYT